MSELFKISPGFFNIYNIVKDLNFPQFPDRVVRGFNLDAIYYLSRRKIIPPGKILSPKNKMLFNEKALCSANFLMPCSLSDPPRVTSMDVVPPIFMSYLVSSRCCFRNSTHNFLFEASGSYFFFNSGGAFRPIAERVICEPRSCKADLL